MALEEVADGLAVADLMLMPMKKTWKTLELKVENCSGTRNNWMEVPATLM